LGKKNLSGKSQNGPKLTSREVPCKTIRRRRVDRVSARLTRRGGGKIFEAEIELEKTKRGRIGTDGLDLRTVFRHLPRPVAYSEGGKNDRLEPHVWGQSVGGPNVLQAKILFLKKERTRVERKSSGRISQSIPKTEGGSEKKSPDTRGPR